MRHTPISSLNLIIKPLRSADKATLILKLVLGSFFLLLHIVLPGHWAYAAELEDPTRALEPVFAQALIAAHDKNFDAALSLLDSILKKSPEFTQALELKALILKGMGKTEDARMIYDHLTKSAGDPKSAAPYHFEMGLIDYNAKKESSARAHLMAALAGKFNLGVTQFLLGTLDLKSGNWHRARIRFEGVIASEANAVKPLAHLYLAQISANNRNTIETIRHLRETLKVDDGLNSNSVEYDFSSESKAWVDQARNEADQALKDLNKAKFFGNVTVLAGFDSNVLSAPSTTDIQGTPSNYASAGTTLKGGIGYSTAPLEKFQKVASYQFSVNMETSAATKTGQFFTHDLSFYLNHTPFAPNSRQTGYDVLLRPYFSYDPGNIWWNPTVSLTATDTQTQGNDYISKSLALNFMSVSRISQRMRLNTTVELGVVNFPDRSGEVRNDHFILFDEALSVQLNPRLSFLGDLQYNNNRSNITTIYQYTRLIASLGLSYAL